MDISVIHNVNMNIVAGNVGSSRRSGFTQGEFRRLASLYARGMMRKAVHDMAVDVDFDEGVFTFTYYRGQGRIPYLQFIVRHVGPRTNMYELYKHGRGRIAKSGLFERIYERLEQEVEEVMEPPL